MSKILRIGLAGCGGQTRNQLAPGLARIPSARLVACADVDASRARQVADEFRIEEVYGDAGELARSGDVDAVIVAVPHRHLKSVALSVLEAGKHLFIEKPIGLNATEGAEVAEAARKRGVVAMVGYCMRYSLSRMFIKALLEGGAVGDVAFVVAGKGGGPLGGWLAAPYAEGGGQLLFLGSHLTDQVLWMTGDDAEAVSGSVRWNAGGTDETSAYTVRLRRGAVASFTVSQATGVSYDFVDVYGTKGRVRGDWYGDVVTVQSRVIPEYAHPTVLRIPGDNLREMCHREMTAFVEAALSAGPSPIPTSDGLRVLRILDAVVASSQSGNWVRM
ncbi:MAG: Gfo/Idh/MocA family oxidoreductase [Candidatus Latescibacteria bacterium]|nr:Gfo/Idh/MocA family oxidoreductase [Candidatus Latescibacterota bacterium]